MDSQLDEEILGDSVVHFGEVEEDLGWDADVEEDVDAGEGEVVEQAEEEGGEGTGEEQGE